MSMPLPTVPSFSQIRREIVESAQVDFARTRESVAATLHEFLEKTPAAHFESALEAARQISAAVPAILRGKSPYEAILDFETLGPARLIEYALIGPAVAFVASAGAVEGGAGALKLGAELLLDASGAVPVSAGILGFASR